jgi:hypothetical protein
MRIIKHNSPESIALAFFNFEKDPHFMLADVGLVVGVDETGAETHCALDEWLRGMIENGFWGFADTRAEAIHVWESADATDEMMLMLVGHELGHCFESTATARTHDAAEEERAHIYGRVAVKAYEVLTRLRAGENEFEIDLAQTPA